MKKTAIYFILCSLPLIMNAQLDDRMIRQNYDSVSFTTFIESIEKETPLHFFYQSSWIDSLIIQQQQVPQSLSEILDETFDGTDMNYFIDGNNWVLTKKYQINNELPNYFYSETDQVAIQRDSSYLDPSFLDKAFEENQDKQQNGEVVIGNPANRFSGGNAVISGIVREEETGLPVIGATVYSQQNNEGTITNPNGYYTLTLPKGKHTLLFKFVGRSDTEVEVVLNESGNLDVEMQENIIQMRDVVITSQKEDNVKSLQVGMEKLNMQTIQQIPTSMGEADIVKTALLLPGVQTVGEAASGFNVRGGGTDQNLILLDGSPIFNSSHMFGFFSVFNSQVIEDFRLYKSGIPPKYGGRVSSVFDVATRDGNRKRYNVSAGISPITGKLAVEGPIIKEKASFLIGARSTYSDWILNSINRPEIKNSEANFYDLNAKVSYDINEKNSVTASSYYSKDFFKLNSDTGYHYQNINASVIWKHSFTKKFFGTISGIYSDYTYSITSEDNPFSAFKLDYNIEYKAGKFDFSWLPNNNHNISFGGDVIKYDLQPGKYGPNHNESLVETVSITDEQAVESAFYINDEINITNNLSVNAGFRYSMFFVLGPDFSYRYSEEGIRTESSRIDSTQYGANELVKRYGGPEFRFSARYKTGIASSVKVGYNRIHQYLHMLSNTTAISPTDIWKISDSNIEPLIGDQVSVGYYKNFDNNTIETSIEAYYKETQNQLDYKGGAELVLNENIETDVISGHGRAYGVEFMVKKMYGHWNGWISYTYSSSQMKADSRFIEERINDGEYYPTHYDKPHDFKLIANYKFSRRVSLSNNFIYNTGRPITYPLAKYRFRDTELVHYSKRNQYRVPDYFRWDISLNLDGDLKKLKESKIAHSSWSFSIYNVTGRENVYSVFFRSVPGEGVQAYKMSIFAQPIVTVTYNIKF